MDAANPPILWFGRLELPNVFITTFIFGFSAMPDTVSTQATTVITTSYSGDYRIDVLLPSASARWNFGSPVGTPVTVSYSFMAAAPTYADDSDKKGFTAFNAEQMSATRQILNLISQQVGITFQEVSDSATSYGDIRFGNNAQGQTSAGYATFPDTTDRNSAGDLYINNEDTSTLSNITVGTNSYATLVHEIGHTLGLKHPGNYNAGEPAATTPDNFLAKAEDSEATTVMSYVKTPQRTEREFFGPYDLLALKYLYGIVAYNSTDTSYVYDKAVGQRQVMIDDTGGADTIDFSAILMGATVDLTAGAFSSVGVLEDGVTAAINNLSIAYDVVIENATGGPANDTLRGNAATNNLRGNGGNDTISGGTGNDTIDGGSGIDTASYSGSRAGFALTRTAGGFSLVDTVGLEGTDALSTVERIKFADGSIALDVAATQAAGQAQLLLGAVLGKNLLATKQPIIGAVIGLIDDGAYSLQVLAGALMRLDIWGILANGGNATATNTQIANYLLTTVNGAVPDSTTLASAVTALNTELDFASQGGFLWSLAQTSANQQQVGLVGLAITGLAYAV